MKLIFSRSRQTRHWSTPAALLFVLLLLHGLVSMPARAQQVAPHAQKFTEFALQSVDRVEANLPEITRLAELMAKRHLAGGAVGTVGGWYEGTGLTSEIEGRSGGLVNIGFDRVWTKDRTAEQKANDMALIGWDSGPWPNNSDLTRIKKLKEAGVYIIGFGPRNMPELAERVALADAWLDTGLGGDPWTDGTAFDREAKAVVAPVHLNDGPRNLLVNMMNAWTLIGEFVGALTRRGKMPAMWMSYMLPEGHAWGDRYLNKKQFHDEFKIAPIAAGTIGKTYLTGLRSNIQWFARTQLPTVPKMAELIAAESKAGRKTIVATTSHAPPMYTAKYEDKVWAQSIEVHDSVDFQMKAFKDDIPNDTLVLRLGYTGVSTEEKALFAQKNQRVLWVSSQNPNEGKQIPANMPNFIDMGWTYGDATVAIEGYPIKILPASGIMQLITYEAINMEVLSRLPKA